MTRILSLSGHLIKVPCQFYPTQKAAKLRRIEQPGIRKISRGYQYQPHSRSDYSSLVTCSEKDPSSFHPLKKLMVSITTINFRQS